ncbi:MAG: metallopeptidase family protein [Candidatus Nanopelagicales bacterium]
MEIARPTRKSRDRHGRGLRGTLTLSTLPISKSRAQQFDELVLLSVERIQRAIPELDDVEVIVEEVPPGARRDGSPDPVPLGRIHAPTSIRPPQLIVHRRPVEFRSAPGEEREALIQDVIAELVAELFGIAPQQVDPDYNPGT